MKNESLKGVEGDKQAKMLLEWYLTYNSKLGNPLRTILPTVDRIIGPYSKRYSGVSTTHSERRARQGGKSTLIRMWNSNSTRLFVMPAVVPLN